jgi:aldose 1-epimerase
VRVAGRVNASGQQVELSAGNLRLTVVSVGGGLRDLRLDDWSVLDGYGPDEVAIGAYGQVLVPWPNRLADGRYEFRGHHYQLPLTEPEKRNAIHGFARWMNWDVEAQERSRAVLSLLLHPRVGYPFALRVAVEYSLTPAGVTIRTTAENVGRSALPYAEGFHPYISAGTPVIDECLLRIPARTWLPTDGRGIPKARKDVEGSAYDFRSLREIGATKLDTGFTDLIRDADGMARLELVARNDSRRVTIWLDRSYEYLMAFSGDTLLDKSRRRRALGVEPMTAAPNAFQTGDGLRTLEPGQISTSSWGIALSSIQVTET